MTAPATVLCDMHIDRLASDDLLDAVFGGLDRGEGGWVVTVNLDILRRHRVDRDARDLYAAADLRVADGMPLVWASRLQGEPVPERVTGASSSWLIAERARAEDRSVYLLGGSPGAAEAAREVLTDEYPGLRVCGVSSPVVSCPATPPELRDIATEVADCRPDIVLVGMGSPKQEHLIRGLRHEFPSTWFVGVGISLSFIAGQERRAPVWVQRAGMEWLNRLTREPGRLARRYLVDDLPFAARLLSEAAARRVQAQWNAETRPNPLWVVPPGDLYEPVANGHDPRMRTARMTPVRYEAPVLRREGSLRELTLGNATGNLLDATFSVNTPVSELTFG